MCVAVCGTVWQYVAMCVTYSPTLGILKMLCSELAVRCSVLQFVIHRSHAGHLQYVLQCVALWQILLYTDILWGGYD